MSKKTVAVIFGGVSSEHGVSLKSAQAVLENLDDKRFEAVPLGITREGRWLRYYGDYAAIGDGSWEKGGCVPAVISPDRAVHGLLELSPNGASLVHLDAAFPVLHGKNGEDGTVQGLLELADIPVVGCGTLAGALCMDKYRAHVVAAAAGVRVPRAAVLRAGEDRRTAEDFAAAVGYPLFVKPVKAGSSFGITRVTEQAGLSAALDYALEYDSEAIIEEAIAGFEVGCAVMGYDILTVGEADEIELSGGFFDFKEKYNLITSTIHVPARVDSETGKRIKDTAKVIYRALGCEVLARVDMFLTPDGELVFNEVNTIPGFTAHSRYPGMMAAAGLPFPKLLTRLVETAVVK